MRRRSLTATLATLLVLAFLAAALVMLEEVAAPDAPTPQSAQPAQPPRPRPTPASGSVTLGSGAVVTGNGYEIAFNAPVYPDDPANHRGGLDERLVALMDRATRTLDVADYDFDLQNVAEAMARAAARGVRVRMVTDTDTLSNTRNADIQRAFSILKDAKVPIVDDQRGPIMHHKFTVVDGEWVSTGSWNYTDGDTYRLNNWMGVFQSKPLAENFTAEFEQMFAGKFGRSKTHAVKNHDVRIGDARVQTCFSPPGKCDQLVERVVRERAKTSLKFLAFSFTHDGIGQAIMERAKAGVKVTGVFETTGSQTTFSEYGAMKQAELEVGLAPQGHHH
jgi:hypothetical protein